LGIDKAQLPGAAPVEATDSASSSSRHLVMWFPPNARDRGLVEGIKGSGALHNIPVFIGFRGCWKPWDPAAEKHNRRPKSSRFAL